MIELMGTVQGQYNSNILNYKHNISRHLSFIQLDYVFFV